MGLRTIPIAYGILLFMTCAISYRWIFNSFEKLGNFLPQSNTSSINSNPTVCTYLYLALELARVIPNVRDTGTGTAAAAAAAARAQPQS